MALYLVGQHGGIATPLAPGLPKLQVDGSTVNAYAVGSMATAVFDAATQQEAIMKLAAIVKAIDPSAVFVASLP